MTKNNLAIRRKAEQCGRRSEMWAAFLLLAKFYRILSWRLRTPVGEIDLIAKAPGGPVCFIEVKTRSDALSAALSLSDRQHRRIAIATLPSHYRSPR